MSTGSQLSERGTGLCRVRIFANGLMLQFRASVEQARNFTTAVNGWPSRFHILIDHEADPDLPWLPCRNLWD